MAAGLLFTMVFFVSWPATLVTSCFHHLANMCLVPKIIMFSDLECDYINPIDLCNKLNQVSFGCLFFEHVSCCQSDACYCGLVCPSREYRPRVFDAAVFALWAMDSLLAQRPATRVQYKQVRLFCVGCHTMLHVC